MEVSTILPGVCLLIHSNIQMSVKHNYTKFIILFKLIEVRIKNECKKATITFTGFL